MTLQLKLPAAAAEKMRVALRSSDFAERLEEFLDEAVIRIADYPALAEIAWNRTERWISARDAFGLYERSWRFVDPARLSQQERDLIDRLSARFGAGIIHA